MSVSTLLSCKALSATNTKETVLRMDGQGGILASPLRIPTPRYGFADEATANKTTTKIIFGSTPEKQIDRGKTKTRLSFHPELLSTEQFPSLPPASKEISKKHGRKQNRTKFISARCFCQQKKRLTFWSTANLLGQIYVRLKIKIFGVKFIYVAVRERSSPYVDLNSFSSGPRIPSSSRY